MAAITTPDHKPPRINTNQLPQIRRVHTLPTRFAENIDGEAQITHLFEVGFAKVVAFQVHGPNKSHPNSQSNSRSNSIAGESSDKTSQDGGSGSVSWVSPTERTLAAGPLRIYRVANTGVSFLNSGEFLRPILNRSQCWCVDDKSIFVLRVRDNAFYRIELPFGTAEEQERAEEFKKTLDSLLRYEKTPCPFREGFIEFDEPPPTPGRRLSGRTSISKAKKWILNKIWEPEDGVWPVPSPAKSEPLNPEGSPLKQFRTFQEKQSLMNRRGKGLNVVGTKPELLPNSQLSPVSPKSSVSVVPKSSTSQASDDVFTDNLDTSDTKSSTTESPVMPVSFKHMRSVTAPPHIMAFASPPSDAPQIDQPELETSSLSSDHDSFYSVDDIDEDFDFSTKYPTNVKSFSPPETPRAPTIPITLEPPSPTLTQSSGSTQINPATNAQNQALRLRRPFLPIMIEEDDSPQTPAPPICQPLSVLSPTFPSPSNTLNGNSGIIQQTCALLMGTPVHLVIMMLRIAARILRKLPGGDKFGLAKIPGAWDSDFEEEEESDEDWGDAEDIDVSLLDDFGYPLGKQKETVKIENETVAEAGHNDAHDGNDELGID